jgi:hypothetical protein
MPRRRTLARLTAVTLAAFVWLCAVALGAGTRAGATRAATRHVIHHVGRLGITLRPADLDLQCSKLGRSRWWCFVYANDGQCTGTLVETYTTRTHTYRARNIDISCGE